VAPQLEGLLEPVDSRGEDDVSRASVEGGLNILSRQDFAIRGDRGLSPDPPVRWVGWAWRRARNPS